MSGKLLRAGGFLAGVVALAVAAGPGPAQDKGDKKKYATIGQIMKKGHGAKGLLKGIDAEAKGGKWDDATNDAALLKTFGENLGKMKPEKGSDESWKKLTDKYMEQTADVAEAVGKKDAKGVKAALAALTGVKNANCNECHAAHKAD